ncbi:MAG TPA: pentapeptide repeat-containing protein [Bacilli bacterium]|nr:pentapeptide repeat-containing protein [Bacilli bacterium]
MKIKGFDKDLKCRGVQFEIGKEYKIELNGRELELCTDTCFHYCNSLQQVHQYYPVNENNRFCEIEVLGEEISDGEKCGSNHIKIVREIVGEELNILKGITNGNTGIFNSGSYNSGNCNSGYRNTGDRNSGNYNSGSYNSGYCNSGDCNSGDFNSGDLNSGDLNSGNCNSGIFNSCDYSNGVFCSKSPKINIFNMPTNMTMREFVNSKYYDAIISSDFILTEWVEYSAEEKAQDETKRLIGGYLKTYSYQEACKNWWANMTDENKAIICSMPNFDAEIFKEITGIEVKK